MLGTIFAELRDRLLRSRSSFHNPDTLPATLSGVPLTASQISLSAGQALDIHQCPFARYHFDPTHARGNTCLAGNTEKTNLTGSLNMGTATEFH